MLHQEVDGIATLTTGEALAYLTGWRNHERRGLVVMEGTQSLVVDTCLTEVDKLTHDINDVRGFHDFIDCRPVYHYSLFTFLDCKNTTFP